MAEEIREARAAVRRSELAAIELAQIEVALALLDRGLPLEPAWRSGFAQRWPGLPAPDGPDTDRTLLLAVRGALDPLARDLLPGSHRLHDLQHEQQARLAAPEHAALRAELDAALAELQALSTRRTLPVQRTTALGPAVAVAERAARDVASTGPARAAALADALAASVAPVLAALGLPPEDLDAATAAAGDPAARIDAVLVHLRGHLERERAEAEATDGAYRALNEALLERMG